MTFDGMGILVITILYGYVVLMTDQIRDEESFL